VLGISDFRPQLCPSDPPETTREDMKTRGIIVVLGLVMCGRASAEIFPLLGGQRAGTAAAQFLKIGVGARVVGMAGVGVAVVDDPSASYWNPAALARLGSSELQTGHVEWLVDTRYEYACVAQDLSSLGTVALSASMLHMDDMEVTTELRPDGTGEYFSYRDYMTTLSYAANLTDRFSVGIGIRYVQEALADLRMHGWMANVGTLYWTGYRTLRFGAALVNFGPEMRPGGTYTALDETSSKYEAFSPPTVFRLGAAMDVLTHGAGSLLVSLQLNHPVDNSEDLGTGLEYRWGERFAARVGYYAGRDEENISFGGGVGVPLPWAALAVDYAYTDFGRLDNAQWLTLTIAY
jgi:hypothetical protein